MIDEYHGRGLARLLTAVLLLDCQDEGLEQLAVNILPENRPALTLARSLGATVRVEAGVSEFDIAITDALACCGMRRTCPGLQRSLISSRTLTASCDCDLAGLRVSG